MNETELAIAVVKSVILLLGGAITIVAYRAYRRAGDPSLRALGAGFGVITLGALVSGAANQFFAVPFETGILVNSIFLAVGLAIIMYSLYMQR
ncbi:hypothetical protein I7X12_12815 [Halosimplex litoreum]|jgi:hypothetical protein|uniref:Uncharacterized protein n=1 Tax=Halosimplex litoreum TaxID=1198301 RepID=A0A7T3KTX2_9EURY|nr:hypothetical protein [Halosimplex litoreum]QPV61634.1 hypothetical protein I7X12_12815 [Halosimplex litoreum]